MLYCSTMNENNYAFIDGQNLYLGTKQDEWSIDHVRFRKYLEEKYKVSQAFYFMGYTSKSQQELYSNLQKAGFIIVFKEHLNEQLSSKKGNVDTDIVFDIMKTLIDDQKMHKVILVSGDGDYKKLVDYLIAKDKFKKILFPNIKFASSLYKTLGNKYCVKLGSGDIKRKIEYINNETKEKGALGN